MKKPLSQRNRKWKWTLPIQTSDGTNLRLTNVGQYKRRTVQTSDYYKHRNKGKQMIEFYGMTKIYPNAKELSSSHLLYSSLYFATWCMILNFHTFKLKLFDLINGIGWNIKGLYWVEISKVYTGLKYQRSILGCKCIGVETSEFVSRTQFLFICCFYE